MVFFFFIIFFLHLWYKVIELFYAASTFYFQDVLDNNLYDLLGTYNFCWMFSFCFWHEASVQKYIGGEGWAKWRGSKQF